VARHLWARTVGDSSSDKDVTLAATRMCTELRVGLTRWVGIMGYRALIDRALLVAGAEHPALDGLPCHGEGEPATTPAARAYRADEVAAAMVALVDALTQLLGRIVGEEMAARLVEQTGMNDERERERENPRGRETSKDRARAES
jgi:hypothetical protein